MKKTNFGFDQIGNHTPLWAKWIFRTEFIVSKAIIGWLAASHLFSQTTAYEVTIFITLLVDPIFFGLSKMFGVKPDQPETDN